MFMCPFIIPSGILCKRPAIYDDQKSILIGDVSFFDGDVSSVQILPEISTLYDGWYSDGGTPNFSLKIFEKFERLEYPTE